MGSRGSSRPAPGPGSKCGGCRPIYCAACDSSGRKSGFSGQVRIVEHSRFRPGPSLCVQVCSSYPGRVRATSVTCGQLGAGVDLVVSFSYCPLRFTRLLRYFGVWFDMPLYLLIELNISLRVVKWQSHIQCSRCEVVKDGSNGCNWMH